MMNWRGKSSKFMAPTQVFQHYLSIVSQESGIPEDKIISKCRETDVVDVRHLLFHILHIYSLYPAQIARLAGMNPHRVGTIISEFDNRLSQSRFMRHVLGDVLAVCPELKSRT